MGGCSEATLSLVLSVFVAMSEATRLEVRCGEMCSKGLVVFCALFYYESGRTDLSDSDSEEDYLAADGSAWIHQPWCPITG